MIKLIATAAIVLAAAQFTTPAHAGVKLNGTSWNGVQLNGLRLNGTLWNGVQLNGYAWNGTLWNGVQLNGYAWNGVRLNGVGYNVIFFNSPASTGAHTFDGPTVYAVTVPAGVVE